MIPWTTLGRARTPAFGQKELDDALAELERTLAERDALRKERDELLAALLEGKGAELVRDRPSVAATPHEPRPEPERKPAEPEPVVESKESLRARNKAAKQRAKEREGEHAARQATPSRKRRDSPGDAAAYLHRVVARTQGHRVDHLRTT